MMVDSNSAVWVSSGSTSLAQLTAASAGAPNFLNGYTTTVYTVPSPSYGVTVTAPNTSSGTAVTGVYTGALDPTNQITRFGGSATSYTQTNGFPTTVGAAGLHSPTGLALDGASNVWAANLLIDNSTGLGALSQISATGTSLSADPGATAGGFQKPGPFLQSGRAVAIDQSGNVWIGQDGANSITEVVGAGVPVYQPFAIGLSNGRFQNMP
jgi:hypothetical protein